MAANMTASQTSIWAHNRRFVAFATVFLTPPTAFGIEPSSVAQTTTELQFSANAATLIIHLDCTLRSDFLPKRA